MRRATSSVNTADKEARISIHALLAESDRNIANGECKKNISIHALLAESDSLGGLWVLSIRIFLSTLSLRRATRKATSVKPIFRISIHALLAESDVKFGLSLLTYHLFLSTLSLRRATVNVDIIVTPCKFLSTLSLRRATSRLSINDSVTLHFYPRSPCGERQEIQMLEVTALCISIHALLAESDTRHRIHHQFPRHFYPRSPCGERPSVNVKSSP